MAIRKSWKEKLNAPRHLPKVIRLTGKMKARWGVGTIVIPSPNEVDALMKQIPKGKLTTLDGIRAELARRHSVTLACPLTTGIFAWIAAHAAEEAAQGGARGLTPYWRILKGKGELNPRYPGGLENMRRLLEAEGHKIISKGNRCFVADYQSALMAPKAKWVDVLPHRGLSTQQCSAYFSSSKP
jgi:hypothetical protein